MLLSVCLLFVCLLCVLGVLAKVSIVDVFFSMGVLFVYGFIFIYSCCVLCVAFFRMFGVCVVLCVSCLIVVCLGGMVCSYRCTLYGDNIYSPGLPLMLFAACRFL